MESPFSTERVFVPFHVMCEPKTYRLVSSVTAQYHFTGEKMRKVPLTKLCSSWSLIRTYDNFYASNIGLVTPQCDRLFRGVFSKS